MERAAGCPGYHLQVCSKRADLGSSREAKLAGQDQGIEGTGIAAMQVESNGESPSLKAGGE